jgi:hypothetical protein
MILKSQKRKTNIGRKFFFVFSIGIGVEKSAEGHPLVRRPVVHPEEVKGDPSQAAPELEKLISRLVIVPPIPWSRFVRAEKDFCPRSREVPAGQKKGPGKVIPPRQKKHVMVAPLKDERIGQPCVLVRGFGPGILDDFQILGGGFEDIRVFGIPSRNKERRLRFRRQFQRLSQIPRTAIHEHQVKTGGREGRAVKNPVEIGRFPHDRQSRESQQEKDFGKSLRFGLPQKQGRSWNHGISSGGPGKQKTGLKPEIIIWRILFLEMMPGDPDKMKDRYFPAETSSKSLARI